MFSYQLEELIKGTRERLVLISPFLRFNRRIRHFLADRNRQRIEIRVVYGKQQLRAEERKWLDSMTSIRTGYCPDLHAKCYLNERAVLLTSMNLYEFSEVNNHEMGVLIHRDRSPALYDQIREETMRIVRLSEPMTPPTDVRSSGDPSCPKCEQSMVTRTVKRGENKGRLFWGCSTFPKCYGKRAHHAAAPS